jgi:nucleotide-binding universal stress UspA family protein
MKTILISTDFSANSTHAVEYGYDLARQIKANVVLCNAVVVPAEIPQAGMVVWPMDEYDVLMDGSTEELNKLKENLAHRSDNTAFQPAITCVNETGILTDVVNGIISQQEIDLVVMGTHGKTGISGFIMGNHSRTMINTISKPLLLVPARAPFAPVKKIAFATDFRSIYDLLPLARLLHAEILLTHIYDEKNHSPEFEKWVKQFLTEISNKADYPHIYYRVVNNSNPEAGLDWLCEHGQVDMLVMIHRPHNFFDSLLQGSHTQKMAGHICIPLLVFRKKHKSVNKN